MRSTGRYVSIRVRIQLCGSLSTTTDTSLKDLVARFTLDSATEFLFGMDVRSLSKGLPYPPTAWNSKNTVEENDFASAFLKAQIASASRGRLQDLWGLREFWKDRVLPHTIEVDKVVIPILEEALRKKAEKAAAGLAEKEVSDEDTLLSSLVKVTDGTSPSDSRNYDLKLL